MKQIFLQQITMVSTATYYFHPQSGYGTGSLGNAATPTTSEELGTLTVGDNGTIRDLNLVIDPAGAAPGAGKSWTATVRINGADTGLTVTIADSDTSARSSASPEAVTPGDKVSIKLTSSGSPVATISSMSLEHSTNTAGYSMVSGGYKDQASTIYGPFGNYLDRNNTILDTAHHRIGALFDFTVRAVYCECEVAPGGTASRGFTFTKNGGTVAQWVVTGANTYSSYTGLSESVSQGDTLGCVYQEISGPAGGNFRYSMLIEASTDGMSWINTTWNPVIDDFKPGFHGGTTNNTTTRRYYCGETGFSMKHMYQVSDPLSASADKDATVYKNGASTLLTCNIPGSGSTANNTSDEVAFADGDYADLITDTTNDSEEGAVAVAMYIPSATPKGLPILFVG